MIEVSSNILQHQPTPGYFDHASDQPDAFAVLCQRHVIINNRVILLFQKHQVYIPQREKQQKKHSTHLKFMLHLEPNLDTSNSVNYNINSDCVTLTSIEQFGAGRKVY